jgi:Flagellar transcriptional activator (FlhC)
MTMRISDNRYQRDRLRLDLALRFLNHGARTHTIRAWTMLSDDRIRKLYRSYVHAVDGPPRHRGKSPQQVGFFMRGPRAQHETGILASFFSLLGVVPTAKPNDAPATLATLARGERICQAFELFTAIFPTARISFEHAIFLVTALARGNEIHYARCIDCTALVVVDRVMLRETRCLLCARGARAC